MSNPPAGWYADPSGQMQNRWWNGDAWTEHSQAGLFGQAAAVVPGRTRFSYRGPAEVAAGINKAANAALILGSMLVGSVIFLPAGRLGLLKVAFGLYTIVLAIVGIVRAQRNVAAGGRAFGRTKAVWGLVLGALGTVGAVANLVYAAGH